MSDSSSGESFLLEELGLNNGSAKEKDKKKSKPKPRKKQSSPKRKPLSLDEIMKSMGIDTPADQPTASTNQNQVTISNDNNVDKNEDTPHFLPTQSKSQSIPTQQIIQVAPSQPQINFVFFESRITDYLNRGLQTITDDFSIELTQFFQFNSKIDDMVTSFIDSFKQTIRDEINFLVEIKSPLENCFDSFAPEFRETYLEIEKMRNLSIPQKVVKLRKAAASVSSYIPTINSRFSHAEITNELNELGSIRSQYKATLKKLFQLKRNLFLNQIELECKSLTQRMESELIQNKMQRLENERSKLDIFDDNSNQSDSLNQNRKLRKLIHDLVVFARKKKESKPKWHFQEMKDTRNAISYYRQLNNYQIDLFEAEYKEIINQRRNQLLLSQSMPPQTFNNNSLFLPNQSQLYMPNSFVQPQSQILMRTTQNDQQSISYDKSKRKHREKKAKVSEVSSSNLSGAELIEHVKRQLQKAEENNRTSLDLTSQYLSSLKKKERKRAHQHITQLIDSDYDMNSLFSLA